MPPAPPASATRSSAASSWAPTRCRAGYYDAYYGSAQKVRTLIQRDFDAAFAQADVLISPTSPDRRLQARREDSTTRWRCTSTTSPPSRRTWPAIPGITVPGGLSEGLPVGIQFLAPAREDARLYRAGAALENLLEDKWGGPLLDQAPELSAATTGGVA